MNLSALLRFLFGGPRPADAPRQGRSFPAALVLVLILLAALAELGAV